MKNNLKRLIAIVLAIAVIASFAVPTFASAATVANVGALWDGFTSGSGTFTVTESGRVYVVGSSAPTGDLKQTAQLIQRELRAQFGESYFSELVWGPADWATAGDIVLNLDSSSGTGADGYKLDVNATTATVTAADVDGLIYGANNLIKCFRAVGGNSISGFSGSDSPDTKERIISLDCGRKYLSAEWIKNFIRQMSWMGYNTIELHFSDDGGYRADFWDPAYYTDDFSPDNDFSWLCGSHVQSWVKNGNKNNSSYDYRTDSDANKYLSTKELVEICEVAKEYHIDIIPSFDSPAHMDYITWKFEQNYKSNTSYSFTYNGKTWKASDTSGCINYTGRTGGSTPLWPYYTTIDITSGTMARAFVFALYEDIADFFKEYAGSTDFSIGADEVQLNTSNLSSGYSYKWGYSKFPGYINDLNTLLNAKGYTMRMFNDFIGTTAYSTTESFDSNIEIMYWDSPFDPNSGGAGTSTQPATYFVNEGRTIYNCIQTHTYHVLRIANTSSATTKYTDARNPANRQWTFYHSTEDLIYDEWVPNNVSEKGDYSESVANIPAANLGGAYFLIWNDYASVSTEAELWNGAPDNTGTNNGVTYYMLDRMASNIIKMWNWDINDTVDYDDFAAVRDTFGDFPGFTSCSADANLPAAAAPVAAEEPYAADHSALEAALENKISNDDGKYTAESYAAYEEAYAAAEKVNADRGATEDEITTAINNLSDAKNNLVEVPVLDYTKLEEAIDNAEEITEQGAYTDESWGAFQTALTNAKNGVNNCESQEQIDTLTSELNSAMGALNDGKVVTIKKLEVLNKNNTVRAGKKIGLRVTTNTDINNLIVQVDGKAVSPYLCVGQVQTLSDLGEVKMWLVYIDTANLTDDVQVTVGTTSENIEVADLDEDAETRVEAVTITVK